MSGALIGKLRRKIDHLQHIRRTCNTDEGMTLTELMIAFTVLIVLTTVASVALSLYLNLDNQVISSYGNTEQVLTVATNLQKLIRSQVEPAPTPTTGANANVPSPPFSTVAGSDTGQYVGSTAVGTFSATFYSNVGNAAGPARVIASETANAVVGKLPTWTFTVTEQIPDANSCPFAVNSAKVCTYTGVSNNPAKIVLSVPDVVNNDTPTTAYAGTAQATNLNYTPIFTYILLQTSTAPNSPGQQVPVSVVSPAPAGFFWPLPQASQDDSIFHACAATQVATPIANTCPGDAVQGVTIDLLIQSPGSSAPTEDNTTVFSLSPTSYLYNPLVG